MSSQKRKGKGKNQQITTEVQTCRGEILLEQVILNDSIQPHSERYIGYKSQDYEELTLTRN